VQSRAERKMQSRPSPSGTPALETSFGVCFQTGPPLRSTMVSA
jgi:hypothetical protein